MRNNYLKTENYYFLITHFDATRRRSGSSRCKKTCLLCPQTCEMNICLINTTQDMQACVSIKQKKPPQVRMEKSTKQKQIAKNESLQIS